ncbi:MAG: agmatinase [Deltaproteobacteria bacterium]|nr:agmatinase [Deltaproteobacteria bacterium]
MTHQATIRFLGDEGWAPSFEEARVVVLPVPYEGTVSYGTGASRGPQALLEASAQLEMYDEELDADLDRLGIFTLPPVAARPTPEEMMEAIRQAAMPAVRAGKLLMTIGGEHSISYGVFTALLAHRNAPFSVLQIDAHGDLRASYGGTPHSHASVMARAFDLGLSLVQVAIRAVSREERDFLRRNGLEANVFWGHRISGNPDDGWMDEVVARLGDEVYITVDMDGLDPSIAPATGTPVPGGLDWRQTLKLLKKVSAARTVIGMDLVELAPQPPSFQTDFLAARLASKMIGYALAKELKPLI